MVEVGGASDTGGVAAEEVGGRLVSMEESGVDEEAELVGAEPFS